MHEARYRESELRLWDSIGKTPTEQQLHLRRNDVNVRVQELGVGPPVLFLHGANCSGQAMASLAGRMHDFRCILLDRPGTGLSDPVATALDGDGLIRFADSIVIDVLDALGLESAHLAATSFGGFFALRSAAAHPERVDRMVQFSWPVGAPITKLPGFMRMMGVPFLRRLLVAMPPNERMVRMMFRRIGHGPSLEDGRITPEDLDCYLALLRHTDTMRNELSIGRGLVSPSRRLKGITLSEDLLARISTPTLFLWGSNDPFGGADTARQLVDRIPDAELELLPGAGHSPWLDDVDHCAKATSTFLSRR